MAAPIIGSSTVRPIAHPKPGVSEGGPVPRIGAAQSAPDAVRRTEPSVAEFARNLGQPKADNDQRKGARAGNDNQEQTLTGRQTALAAQEAASHQPPPSFSESLARARSRAAEFFTLKAEDQGRASGYNAQGTATGKADAAHPGSVLDFKI